MTVNRSLDTTDAWKRSDTLWPNQTELEVRLLGKRYHHEIHCNADRRKPMGCEMCSCKYSKSRRVAQTVRD